jgi:type I restriction enzyme, S subunit
MEVKPGYKQSEMGVIPEDWDVFKLGDIIDYTKGFAFQSSEYQSTGIRIVRVSDTTYDSIKEGDAVFVSETNAPLYANWRLRENDLVISTVGSKPPMYDSMVGKVILISKSHENSLLNQNAVLMRDRKRRAYVQWLLLNHLRTKRFLGHIEAIYRGNANQASITLKELFQFVIPLPSDELEQRAIAGALGNVDALLGALEKLIAKKRDLKQAAMQQLLTGQTRLPIFTGEWVIKRLRDVGTFTKGKGIKKDEIVADGRPCIRYGEIYTHYNDCIRGFHSFIPLKVARESQRLKKGDLLFAGSGETAEEIGKCVAFLGDEEAYAGGDIVILSPAGQNSMYLGYLMNHTSIVEQKARMGQGDAVVHISAGNLGQLNLRLPLFAEQTAIAAVLSDMDAEIVALEARLAKTRALKQGMMQELLTGRTRLV